MSEEHEREHDLAEMLPGDEPKSLEELTDQPPIETATAVANDAPAGTLPLAGGGILLVSALRSLLRGQLRAIPKALAGAGLVRYGLGKRRASSGDEAPTFDPSTDVEGVEGGTEGKETSDAAATATGSPEGVEIDETGEIPDEADFGEEDDSGSRIEFVDEGGTPSAAEPHSTPDLDDEATEDPRLDDEDDDVEIDLSQSATAEEASEAAGPTAGQSQPAQTDSTEPDETPEEDASHMKVEPDDEDELESGTGEEGTDDEPEAESDTEDEDEET